MERLCLNIAYLESGEPVSADLCMAIASDNEIYAQTRTGILIKVQINEVTMGGMGFCHYWFDYDCKDAYLEVSDDDGLNDPRITKMECLPSNILEEFENFRADCKIWEIR